MDCNLLSHKRPLVETLKKKKLDNHTLVITILTHILKLLALHVHTHILRLWLHMNSAFTRGVKRSGPYIEMAPVCSLF